MLSREEFNKYIPSLKRLFEVSFEREISEEFFRWRYLDNPIKDLFVAVAIDQEEVVANYSVSPVQMKQADKEFKTALSMTTMTHPSYSGRGLFTQLAEVVYDEMKEKNYTAVWGFPV